MDDLSVLRLYANAFHPINVRSWDVAGGGLSGARIWRVQTEVGELCLRRWPAEHPTPERLAWIHAVLTHVRRKGIRFVPVPIAARDGQTFVALDGCLWELSPWMPGRPIESGSADAISVSAALEALALFHTAAETFADVMPRSGPAPAVEQRLERIGTWMRGGGVERMEQAADKCGPPLGELAQEFICALRKFAPAAEQTLRDMQQASVALQPCLRDIHDQHVLFETEESAAPRVTGIIDFGALRVDTVATDVARLLGTMAGNDRDLWDTGLAAYRHQRPLSEQETQLATAIDRANVVLTGPQWIEWLLLDRRQFDAMSAIAARLERIHQRLRKLT